MKKPVRVLHVFNWFNQGGIENFVMNVYRNIDRDKIQFDFAFLENREGYFDKEALELGARIYYYKSDKNTLWNHYSSLSKIIKKNGPYAAVHSHIYFFSGYILWIAKRCGVPIRISHSHETKKGRKETLMRKIYESLMRMLIKGNSTNCLACSDAAGKYVFSNYMNYQVLYNGIDLKRFTFEEAKRIEYRNKLEVNEKKVILNVGRFTDQKNHEFIIDIFAETLKRKKDVVLVLIGTGPLKETIENKLRRLGIFDKVIFLSNIMDTENYYRAADVFILPSKYEGMSIVSIEAQSTGLYSLLSGNITREVGATEIVEYLDIKDPCVWADKILKVVDLDYNREIYNRKFINSSFDIRKTIKDLQGIYLNKQN